MSLLKCISFFLLMDSEVLGFISSKEIEGFAEGYLGNCYVHTRYVIAARSLKDLGIVVAGGDGSVKAYRHFYNYYLAKEIPKDPNLDFTNKKTVFFFNGFLDYPDKTATFHMPKAYRRLGYNVLLVSANKFMSGNYPKAVRFLQPIGKHLAEMLTNLTAAGLDPGRLEFTGVSLGAQLMSFVAKSFQQLTGRNVSQLTALDPAGACLRNLGPEGRIDAGDADFVQIMHTNIDWYGMAAPVGHVDFYINGGEYQPSDIYWMPCPTMCSHYRAFLIWLVALENPTVFLGMKCDSVQQARRNQCYDRVPRETNVISHTKTDRSNTGIFYVATDNNYPYYLGSRGLKKENEFWTKHLFEWNKNDTIIL